MKRDLSIAGDVFVDVETASLADLLACGSDVYFADPSTEVLILDAITDSGEVISWTIGEPPPPRLFELVLLGWTFWAHNVIFEQLAFQRVLCKRHGFPMPQHWKCTAARARYNALPGKLENAATALNLPVGKDMAGHRLMLTMCRPRGFTGDGRPRWWHVEEPQRLERLHSYCLRDSVVSRSVHAYTRTVPPEDEARYELIARMNARGIGVDLPLATAAANLAQQAREHIDREMRILTKGRVDATTKVAKLKQWIGSLGVQMDSLDKREVARFLETNQQADIPAPVREAIAMRLEYAKSSVAKFNAMIARCNADGRVTDSHIWNGASTGRLSAQGLQLQNFKRDIHPQALLAISYILKGDFTALRMLFGDVLSLLSTLLRPTLRATNGRMFVGGDLSQIEARVTAWLARDKRMLAAFEAGLDLYKVTASAMFGVAYEAVTELQRQAAKVSDLALGFGGSVGALMSMGLQYSIVFEETRARELVDAWRASHPQHRVMWKAVELAAHKAVMNPRTTWSVSCGADVSFAFDGTHLYCRLPSGRLLTYRDVTMVVKDMDWGPVQTLEASGVDSLTKRYVRYELTRVILVENIVQAIAADVMFEGLRAADEAGFEPVMSVHDELVCEPPLELLQACKEQLGWKMTQPLPWSAGLPMAVKVWSAERYMKS